MGADARGARTGRRSRTEPRGRTAGIRTEAPVDRRTTTARVEVLWRAAREGATSAGRPTAAASAVDMMCVKRLDVRRRRRATCTARWTPRRSGLAARATLRTG